MHVYDIEHDTVLMVKTNEIPGITDEPDYKKDYPKEKSDESKDVKPLPRPVFMNGPVWSPDGKNGVVVVRSQDNKDRWIMLLDCATQKLSLVDRQRDEAWIGGPTVGGFGHWLPAHSAGSTMARRFGLLRKRLVMFICTLTILPLQRRLHLQAGSLKCKT